MPIIVVAGQSNVAATPNGSSLTLVAGTNMTITTNATVGSVTFNASGGTPSNTFSTLLVAGQNNINANTSTSPLNIAAGANMTITTNGVSNTITFAVVAGASDITSPQLSPTQITADTDDYAPTGYTTATVFRANTSESWSLGGLVRGTANSVILVNVGGRRLLLNHDANTSAANNRFFLGEDQVLVDANTSAFLVYDFTRLRWTVSGGERKVGKGFFAGGQDGTATVVTDRTTYSTETTAAVSGANLLAIRYYHIAAGPSTKGFFCGGYGPGPRIATSERTTYATESTGAASGATLSSARDRVGAAGNASKGFFIGGSTGSVVATADRNTYASETMAAVAGANLSVARHLLAAAGNASKGFFAGGFTSVVVATADRCTYSTEVTAAVSGANLSSARQNMGAVGNAFKGFFAGGFTSVRVATADRCTYATEVTAAVAGANLTGARDQIGASGNATKGFFMGGYTGSFIATVDRCTYSTETTAAVTGANLSLARELPGTGTGIF